MRYQWNQTSPQTGLGCHPGNLDQIHDRRDQTPVSGTPDHPGESPGRDPDGAFGPDFHYGFGDAGFAGPNFGSGSGDLSDHGRDYDRENHLN